LHPGRAAQIVLDGAVIGVVGELHPQWVQKYELPLPPVVFELDLDALKRAELPQYAEVSRFPPVIRDLAIVVDQEVVLQCLLDGLSAHSPALIQDIRLFDVYTGKGIDPGKKSVAFRIVMQDTQRTLQDAEVDAAVQHLVAYLQSAYAAQLRV
jgi:phenylalanyl-tRNA synthetase beta chain